MTFNVTNSTGAIVYTTSYNRSSFTNYTNLSSGALVHGAGESYTARLSAAQAQVGFVNKSHVITWGNLRTLEGYPEWVGQWIGILAIVIVAGATSFVNVKYTVVIIPVLTFFMMNYTRWLNPYIGTSLMITSLGVLLTLGVLRYIRDSKGKLGRT